MMRDWLWDENIRLRSKIEKDSKRGTELAALKAALHSALGIARYLNLQI